MILKIMIAPIQIKRPEVTGDIRRLAALTRLSITDAIATAVRNQLAVEMVKADVRLARRQRVSDQALSELRRLPVVGRDLSDSDLYDSNGLPR